MQDRIVSTQSKLKAAEEIAMVEEKKVAESEDQIRDDKYWRGLDVKTVNDEKEQANDEGAR